MSSPQTLSPITEEHAKAPAPTARHEAQPSGDQVFKHQRNRGSIFVKDVGIHALITSATAVGEATAILPVVSTLVFGFAVEELLKSEQNRAVLMPIGISASLSLFTTTFSVLEFCKRDALPRDRRGRTCLARAHSVRACIRVRFPAHAPSRRDRLFLAISRRLHQDDHGL